MRETFVDNEDGLHTPVETFYAALSPENEKRIACLEYQVQRLREFVEELIVWKTPEQREAEKAAKAGVTHV